MKNPTFGMAAINAETNALVQLLDGGFLRFYDGAQPTNPDSSVTTQTLLVELRWATPAFGASVNGQSEANQMEPAYAESSGQASWFRALRSDGTTGVFDGTVGAAPGQYDVALGATTIQQDALVSVSGFSYRNPRQL
jgi:hypothetical protein